MMSAPVIRRALPGERGEVVATVTAAFAEDPAWAFLMGEEYQRLAPEFVGALFDLRAPGGNVWVSDDLATAAMWESPSDEMMMMMMMMSSGPRRLGRATSHWPARKPTNDLSPTKPPSPPSAQRIVIGTWGCWQLIQRVRAKVSRRLCSRPMLGEADRLGIACCLETSTVVNRRFYERRGFLESTEVVIPAGPPTWWLRRAPPEPLA